MVKKIQLIRQMGTADCVASAQYSNDYFCFSHVDKIDVNDIKANTRIGRDGLSLAKMKEIVEAYGFIFKSILRTTKLRVISGKLSSYNVY